MSWRVVCSTAASNSWRASSRRHLGDAFELGCPFVFELCQVRFALVQLGLALIELAVALLDLLQAAFHRLLAALDALFGAIHFAPPADDFLVGLFK